jgi:O-antigen/teichoic acid export membrane protein
MTSASPSTSAAKPSSLSKRVRRGTLISMSGQLSINAIQLGSNLILTRILMPQAFGLMAIVNLICDGLQQISSIGIQPAIIRSPHGLEPKFLQTAFTLQVMRGVLLCVIGLFLAYPLALLYEESQLTGLICAASLSALILGLQSIHWATTTRALKLERTMAIQAGSRLFSALTTIAFALAYQSVWALVIGLIAGNLFRVGLSHLFLPGERSRLEWDRDSAGEILRFGQWILVSTFLGFLAIRLDIALLGRLLPLEMLGVYSVGVLIPNIIRQLASIGIQRVLMPALSELYRIDGGSLNRTLVMARRLLLPVASVLALSCVAVSPAFFRYLYDARYHDAGWIAQLTALSLWFGFLQDTGGRALLVLGHSRAWAICVAVRTLTTAAGALIGFSIAGLPGLIVGVGSGAAAGYFSVAICLAPHGIRVIAMDLRHTGVTAMAALAVGLGPRLIPIEGLPLPLATLLVGTVVLIPYGLWTLLRLLESSRAGSATPRPVDPEASDV